MELHLNFAGGSITGDGMDDVGAFLIKGSYDATLGECHWTKSYIGGHDVSYRGFREGKGIWGVWDIKVLDHGGFRVWPSRSGEGEALSEVAESGELVEASQYGLQSAGAKVR